VGRRIRSERRHCVEFKTVAESGTDKCVVLKHYSRFDALKKWEQKDGVCGNGFSKGKRDGYWSALHDVGCLVCDDGIDACGRPIAIDASYGERFHAFGVF